MKESLVRILGVVLLAITATAVAGKPHIVVYLSDDHSQYDCSLYGDATIPTPHMEQLGADGMVFDHAFIASPSCAPSRAALLTGLMPARNGAEDNHSQPRPGTHSLVENLKQAGYKVAAFGKVSHGRASSYGFDYMSGDRGHDAMRENARAYIKSHNPAEQPLCLFIGTSNPHVAWPMENDVDPNSVAIPPHSPDCKSLREHRAAYAQEVINLDILLGELRTMAREELGEDVLFIYTSDHGGQWPFGKWTLYDYGTRVPFVAAWPGKIKPGGRAKAMISWIDLVPTLIDVAGGAQQPDIDGKSFLPVLLGSKVAHRDLIFTTHSGDRKMNVYPSRAVRDGEWKLIHNLRPELAFTNHSDLHRKPGAGAYWHEWTEMMKSDPKVRNTLMRYFQRPEYELFHVAKDRWELNNLINNPEQKRRVKRMKQRLEEWMAAQGDTRSIFNVPRPLDQPETWHPDYFGKHPNSAPKKKAQPRKK